MFWFIMSNMDHNSRVPAFTGKNYPTWKIRMIAYLQSLGSDVFKQILIEYIPPVVDGVLKDFATYTAVENTAFCNNGKARNALFRSLNDDDSNRVSECEFAFAIWDYLKLMYEGDKTVHEQQR